MVVADTFSDWILETMSKNDEILNLPEKTVRKWKLTGQNHESTRWDTKEMHSKKTLARVKNRNFDSLKTQLKRPK